MAVFSYCLNTTFIVTALLLAVFSRVLSSTVCPRDVVAAVFTCLAPLRGPDANQLVTAGDDLQAVKDRCRDGSFHSAVRCVEVLLHQCRHSNQLDLLQDLTDITRMEQSFGLLCDNVGLYAANTACLVKEDTTIQNCMLMNSNQFYHNPNSPNNREDEVIKICSFLTEMTRCIDQPVRYYCDKNLADVLVKFMSGLTPPVCRPYLHNRATNLQKLVWDGQFFSLLFTGLTLTILCSLS